MTIETIQDLIDIYESLKKMDPNTKIIFRDSDYNEYNIKKEYNILDDDSLNGIVELLVMD